MSRGPIPRFDLYEELEVSRQASPEVIEAAYRVLVKRHHPDVAGRAAGASPGAGAAGRAAAGGGTDAGGGTADETGAGVDAERIKRLNVAHDWLASPAKRARYDEANPIPSRLEAPARTAFEAEPQPDLGTGGFGPKTTEVRQFLADLRALDWDRALEIAAAKATIGTTEYAEARGAALHASRNSGLHDQWLLARDAANVIARGKLQEGPAVAEIAAIVSDIAGAMVVRDRMPLADYQTLLRPWTSRPAVATDARAAVVRPTDHVPVRPVAAPGVRAVPGGRRSIAIGVAAAAVLAVVGFTLVGGILPKPSSTAPPLGGVAFEPTPPAASPTPVTAPGATVAPPTTEPTSTSIVSGPIESASASPGASQTDPTAGSTSAPTPRITPRPTPAPTPTPTPTPRPTPTPAPTPTPTPVPTPSPKVICTVPQLVGQNSANVLGIWSAEGFTGTITYAPVIPPQYKIAWQSLTAGSDVLCTSDITVAQVAP